MDGNLSKIIYKT